MFDTISNLPEISNPDLPLTNQLVTATWRLVSSRREKEADQVESLTTLKDIIEAITEDSVTSMFWVVELSLFRYGYHKNTPSREEALSSLTTLENICRDERLDIIPTALQREKF